MPITIAQCEPHWLIRLSDQVTVGSAAELRTALLDWSTSEKALELDLQKVSEIDVTVLQLLWAAQREAARNGVEIVSGFSEAVERAARVAGFEAASALSIRVES